MENKNHKVNIAVIGAGALGLVAIKNLLEEGFNVTGFERKSYVGGLWKYTPDGTTSVLKTTFTNISKERSCFTDFPFPDDTPSLCSWTNVYAYLESYADHFGLRPHIRLNTAVKRVTRNDKNDKWTVEYASTEDAVSQTQDFDKLVMATGINQSPHIPKIEGIDSFAGTVLHSQAFKRPEDFTGKTVVVVGIGNTAADTAVALIGHAKKIYISHRHGAYILPRKRNGRSIDHNLSYRLFTVQGVLERLAPSLSEKLLNKFIAKLQNEAFPAICQPQGAKWHLWPPVSIRQSVPTVTDELVPALEQGRIESVAGIKSVGKHTVHLDDDDDDDNDDGTAATLDDVDTIIFCTGYISDLGTALLEPHVNPVRNTSPAWLAATGSRGKPLPRLYRNVFSLDYPQSLVFMGAASFPTPAFQLYDQASMAVAQIWGGRSSLPSQAEMEQAVDTHHSWMVGLAKRGPVYPGLVRSHEWLAWADKAAGTGVGANLGWGWQGWRFWLTQHRFYKLLTTGVYSPHLYRVFSGSGTKRKAWAGAREAIEQMNQRLATEEPKTK
ncbi:Flavin monooxygenase-like protein [Niveomyces insectorum RCEF 264]|uniref:Flavin monooxygenase-like protein n=1 Tax=Niveomyces insectorum RCEF 264 TaxID=1081102 RepID=A0A167YNC9_9HYPO|nr:Flavin monooxygenase-like protein [Niveomyces insectorum RCEF 264]